MKLSTRPFRWISVAILLLAVTALGLLADSTFRRPPRPSGTTAPAVPAPPPTRSRPPSEPRPPQTWVIAIGIDHYQDEEIPASRGAVHDARSVGHWFSGTAGWGPENVLLMDDLGQAEPGTASDRIEDLLPTRANLDWAFRLWLGARMRPDDQLVVFFAGQTIAQPPALASPSGTAPRTYFLPIDAQRRQPERTGWHLDEAIDPWAETGRHPVLCWLDTSLEGRGRGYPHPVDVGPGASLLPGLVRWPGVSAWVAAEHRPSGEASKVGDSSPFTEGLLKALGTPGRPANLLACLDALTRDQRLTRQGFRTMGGIDPNLTLWSKRATREALARRELILQRGHARGVSAMEFTADGSRLITGSQDSTVKIWGVLERAVLHCLPNHLVGVGCLDLSADGRWLASGDGSGRLRIRDLVRDVDLPSGPHHERGVDQLAFLPGADRLVSLDLDGKAWLWSTASPASPLGPLSGRATGLAHPRVEAPLALAVAEADGKVRLFDREGRARKTLDGPGEGVTGRRMDMDGSRLAAAGERRVVVRESESGRLIFEVTLNAPVDTLALAPSDRLAIADGLELVLVALDRDRPEVVARMTIPAPANQLAFSNDGRWLAVGTATGQLLAYELSDAGEARPLPLENPEGGHTATLAFSPDGRCLTSGDQEGGLRFWDLPDGRQRPPVPPRRGQVAGISVSDDGRYLLQVSQDWHAQVWDLQDGRGLTAIEGRWTSGALSPDGATLYLTGEEDGDVVAVDRAGGEPRPLTFERPGAEDGGAPSRRRFGRVAVSRDGRWVAAGSLEGPLACVWDASSGRLVQRLEGHRDPDPITAVAFSAESDRLLTASEDGTSIVWDLSDPSRPASRVATHPLLGRGGAEPVPVSAAAIAPGKPLRAAAGGIGGEIVLWKEGEAGPIELGRMEYPVQALAFTGDGRYLAAAGADKAIWLWDMQAAAAPRRVRLEPMPHHAEQINALLAWPGGKVLASAADDTTIRLWSLESRTLLGTLSAEQGTTDWVAYTPDGLFDSSIGGERQVTWRDERGFLALEQVYDQFHVYKLTDQLRRGARPEAPERPRRAPPRVTIDRPTTAVQLERTATLTISLGETDLTNLRLYQDGVPVQADEDFPPAGERKRFTTQVRLRHGVNRFHLMAGRPEGTGIEGRSEDVEIRCDASDPPGRVHVLALGVGEYRPVSRALKFADDDARDLAGFLESRGRRADAPGLKIVLTDRQVNRDRVNEAFALIREQVKDRPEDTVVVFLAGHADVINNRFVMLLSTFPFAGEEEPTVRGAVDPETVLSYVSLYRNIARLGSLQRLVVIDACQAEAINDDPGVRKIQQTVDDGSQRSKTAYLLAARRGEPASEAAALKHGLMTYALLKGLGARDLEDLPGLNLSVEKANADRDGDRVITTAELRGYVSATVPALAERLPLLVQRAGIDATTPGARPEASLRQSPRIQASETTFSLVELPAPDARPDDVPAVPRD